MTVLPDFPQCGPKTLKAFPDIMGFRFNPVNLVDIFNHRYTETHPPQRRYNKRYLIRHFQAERNHLQSGQHDKDHTQDKRDRTADISQSKAQA